MTTGQNFQQGPFLSAALLCEKVLEETGGVKSAIRIIDRIMHAPIVQDSSEAMKPFDYQLVMLIKVKAGRARGNFLMEVRLGKPSGEMAPPMRQTLMFEGDDDHGVDVVVNMRIRFDQIGIYWFHVSLDGVKLTQIPFRVSYMPQFMPTGSSGGSPQLRLGP